MSESTVITTLSTTVLPPNYNQNLTVVKHNALNEASYNLPLDARRLLLSALSKIKSKQDVPNEIEIHSEEFAEQWGIQTNNAYNQLKRARDVLYNDTVRTEKLGEGEGKGEVWDVRWLDAAAYQDGEGYIKISFSERLKPYLSHLQSHYTSYRLHEVKNIKSSHAIRIYELLMQYKDTGWYQVEVEDLKEKLRVADKYPIWSEFKRNVVQKAIVILNKNTGFNVHADYMKRGKYVKQIRFTMSRKPQADMFMED